MSDSVNKSFWVLPNGTTATTQSIGNNSTKVATTAYVNSGITGSGALTFTAGGSNQNVTLTPSGSGYSVLNGIVCVNTTSPSSPAGLTNYLQIYQSSSAGIVLTNSSVAREIFVNGTTLYMTIGTGSAKFALDNTGALQLAKYGAGAATFDASGNITSVSDARLKNIKGHLKYGLKEILQIRPILFKWKKKSGLETKHVYAGFSAQEIQKLIPETVGQNDEGYLSLSDRGIEGALVNAIKELNAKIERLEKINGRKKTT